MAESGVKKTFFEVLRGEYGVSELVDHLDREMQSVVAEDVRYFIKRTFEGIPEDDVVFVRVPKCATTSIHFEIQRAYRSIWAFEGQGLQLLHPGACDDVAEMRGISTWDERMAVVGYYLAHPKTRYVAGHFTIDAEIMERFGDEYSFVTTLRDPVDRWLSHYLYNKHRQRTDERYDIDTEIEEFLETERGRGIGQIALAYFSGTGHLSAEERETEAVQRRARENLRKFDVVGFVEDLRSFERKFSKTVDFEIELEHRNENPAPDDEKRVGADVRAKIREACRAEIELYEWAREEFG